MAIPKNRPPCPNCGGTKQTPMSGGLANDGDIPILYAKCNDCGYCGYQFTDWIPEGLTSLNRLDASRRLYQKLYRRQQRGALAQVRPLQKRKDARIQSDELVITVTVSRGFVQAGLAKRLPGLTRKRSQPITEEIAS